MFKKKKEGKEENTTSDAFSTLKRTNEKRAKKRRILYIVIILTLLLAFAIVSIAVFFRVQTVTVHSSGLYSYEEIAAASGIEYKEQIFALNENQISENIIRACPMVRSVKLDRHLPTEVVLIVDCDAPDYYLEIDSEFFIVSRNLKVLERMWSKEAVKERYPSIKKIGAGEVKSAIVGGSLEFVNSMYENDTKELISYIENCDFKDSITSFDISDRYNIKIVYESRLQATCGDIKNMAVKLKFFSEIAKDLGKAGGTVDIKDVSTGYVLVDNNKVFE